VSVWTVWSIPVPLWCASIGSGETVSATAESAFHYSRSSSGSWPPRYAPPSSKAASRASSVGWFASIAPSFRRSSGGWRASEGESGRNLHFAGPSFGAWGSRRGGVEGTFIPLPHCPGSEGLPGGARRKEEPSFRGSSAPESFREMTGPALGPPEGPVPSPPGVLTQGALTATPGSSAYRCLLLTSSSHRPPCWQAEEEGDAVRALASKGCGARAGGREGARPRASVRRARKPWRPAGTRRGTAPRTAEPRVKARHAPYSEG